MLSPTILLVEDNALTRKLIRFTLTRSGYDVAEAPDGQTAVDLMATRAPRLVLQDLILPDADGFELVKRLRAATHGRDVPILALTGFLSKHDEGRISAVGFDDVITKPVEPSQLVRIVQAYVPMNGQTASFGRGRRVLVVDDDPVQRKLVAFRLASVGYVVATAGDGAEALERVKVSPPDLIVSDVMMPRLDGFGLCVAVRQLPDLARVPVVLVSNAYIEHADRELARRVGAASLVLRTPDLKELLDSVRAAASPGSDPGVVDMTADVERQRVIRVMNQLERQVAINAGTARRCAELSAELAVLRNVSDALSRHQDLDRALDEVLALCFDAGGISIGALYLTEADRDMRVRGVGSYPTWKGDTLETFFGKPDVLASIIATGEATLIPSSAVPADISYSLLDRSGAASALVVPVVHQGERLGALLMLSSTLELDNEFRITFAQSVAGQIGQALVLARTFLQKVASERAAKLQAETLRSIIDSIGDGVSVADESGRIVLRNRSALLDRPFGPEISAADGPNHFSAFLPDQVTPYPVGDLPLARAVRGELIDGQEVYIRSAAGAPGRWLSVNARPLLDEHGVARGGVSVHRDVTIEKSTQQQLTMSDRMVSIGMLASGVGHEINNPLSAVIANLDLAMRDIATLAKRTGDTSDLAEIAEELGDAREGAQRIREIVRDLRIFSRSEEEKRVPVVVERVLESALRMARNEIRHRARIVKSYAAVPLVRANESRLGQLFLNLIVNAAQAIEEGNAEQNEIGVSTRIDDSGRVGIDISDTGSGMPPDIMRRLFTPFFTTKPAGVGTGLGLSICQRIVADLGGEISVDSEVGRGTTFHVWLPATQTRVSASVEVAVAVPEGRRGRVLVVDDEVAILLAVRRTLGSQHEVMTTTRAAEALELVTAGNRYDAILCDLMMPEMTGMNFYGELAKLAPEQLRHLVFMSGGAFTPTARAFLDEASNATIEKPFEPDALRALVDKLVSAE